MDALHRMDAPPPQKTDGQQAGGTDPIGMHTCFKLFNLVESHSSRLILWEFDKVIVISDVRGSSN